jgi:hypothetical protein
MGYVVVMSPCLNCGSVMSYNPNKVPAVRDAQGVKQPICEPCHTALNNEREKLGLERWPEPMPGAYEVADENSINWDLM